MHLMMCFQSVFFQTREALMDNNIIWLHEKALSNYHLVLQQSDEHTKIIHVWDDEYLRKKAYSLKRLVFIYEALGDLPVEIIYGNTINVFKQLSPQKIIVPHTLDSEIRKMCTQLSESMPVDMIHGTDFVELSNTHDFKRFFQYWKKACKSAFCINGCCNDQ